MILDTKEVFSMTQANGNFSSLSRVADTRGKIILTKNGKPKYLVVPIDRLSDQQIERLYAVLEHKN